MEKIHLSNKQKKYYDYFLKELNLICLSLNENTKMNFKITKIQNKVQQFLIILLWKKGRNKFRTCFYL